MAGREQIETIIGFHRLSVHKLYLGYEQRQLQGVQDRSQRMSAATDGGSETRTVIPYTKNDYQFNDQLPFHVQGVTIHGFVFLSFFSFSDLI